MPFLHPPLKNIDTKEILRYAGMREYDTGVEKSLENTIKEAYLYCQPKGVWEPYEYKEFYLLRNGQRSYHLGSTQLCRHLQGALRIMMLAVTVGTEVETRIEKLFASGEYTKALLLDAAATAAVEQIADKVCAFIANSVKKEGLIAGTRFSPGYGDWDIREQGEVLSLANAGAIGISMTKSCMLIPRKSVTAALGLKPFAEENNDKGDCARCEKIDCQLRRKKDA